jgi:hypothetical protein
MNRGSKQVSRLTWVYISGVMALLFIILAVGLIFFAPQLTAYGITGSIYYIVLIPVGLTAAAFLFGAMHSHAKYVGKGSYGQLEITGPAVLFALVVIGGFYLAEPESTFFLTVRTEDADNQNKIINHGTLTVDLGSQRITRHIGSSGEVMFAEIPSKFISAEIMIIPEIEGYRLKETGAVKIPGNKVIYLPLVRREDSTLVRGTVIDKDGNSVAGVNLDFESGLASAVSDEAGRFSVTVPEAAGKPVMLIASKNGRIGYREYVTLPERSSIIVVFND